ncbi:MAG: CDP-paratose 2-epimerase [Syntrophorhabdus sp. PtaU1.Bin153]|nr:MAG: CDP-paratose 2-epimerase [Syntrophorhabdus sp. PtaU1.Bin153]
MSGMSVFKDREVLITGGLGFIGSNLAIELVRLGARVTIVDNMLPRQGSNFFNIKDIEAQVKVNISDVRNQLSMNHLVKGKDYIFHLAGQVNHVDSMRNPIQDLDINCRGTLVLLEALRQFNRSGKVIFAGTRGEYGSSVTLPVDEDHPTNPKGIYAVTNLTAEKMVLVYDDVFGIKGACLRITNTYGPRHQMMHDEYGVFNWFIRKALDHEDIPVFGDGRILRDFLYVDDLVACMLATAATDKAYGEVFNVGTGVPVSFIDLALKIVEIAGSGRAIYTEFTQERKEVEPGDYYADITKIKEMVKWVPEISLEDGIQRTIDYYRENRKEYW